MALYKKKKKKKFTCRNRILNLTYNYHDLILKAISGNIKDKTKQKITREFLKKCRTNENITLSLKMTHMN